jgi:PAS domain S-box-containing protein
MTGTESTADKSRKDHDKHCYGSVFSTKGTIAMMAEIDSLISLIELLKEYPALKGGMQLLSVLILIIGLHRYLFNPALCFQWKLLDTIEKVNLAIPTLLGIAEQFKTNGGNSLRDVLDRMEDRDNIIEERMLALLKASTNPYFETNHEGMYLWVNRRWCEITGMIPDDAIGDGWISTVHPEDQAKVSAQWKLCVSQKREFNLQYRIITACEEKLTIPVQAVAHVMWADGKNERVQGFIGQITEIKPKTTLLTNDGLH